MEDVTGIWRPANPRHCPRCTYPMVAIGYHGTEVDHCHRCGGMLVEPGSIDGHLGEWARPRYWKEELARPTTGQKLTCPVDHSPMTGYQVPWETRSVVIDQCDDCGSLFFDPGEAAKLRDIVEKSRADGYRAASAGPGVDGMLSDAELLRAQEFTEKPGVATYLFQLVSGMPVEVMNPVYGTAWVIRTLAVLLVLVYAWEMMALIDLPGEAAQLSWLSKWGLVPANIFEGRYLHTLVTHGFLHGGIVHLLGNVYFLWIFGDNVEDRVGRWPFLLLYFAALFGAAVLQVIMQSDPLVPLVGASGAIAGVMGAYFMLFPKVKLWVVLFFIQWRVPALLYFGFWIGLQFLMGWLDIPGVGWWAHAGGFVVGLVLGYFMRGIPHPLAPDEKRVVDRYERR